MWRAILVLAAVMTSGELHAQENRVTVRALSQRLQLTGWQTSWAVKGEIVPPLHPLPGGRILAIVKAPVDGLRELVLWDKEGHELTRNALDLKGEVEDWRQVSSKLLLASQEEIVEFDTGSLRPTRRRAFVCPYDDYTIYRLGPSGLWIMNEKTVNYFDLNGEPPVVRACPLTPVKLPPCPADSACSKGLIPQNTQGVVSDSGDLMILETFSESYPFKDSSGMRDQVWPSIATVLDTKGVVVAQKSFSWVKTKWEWFWSVRLSQNPGPFPDDWGLVRTRHETKSLPASEPVESRGNDFLFVSGPGEDSGETVIRRMDRRLETRWKRSFQPHHGIILSPSWTTSMFLHDGLCYRFSAISERGRDKKEDTITIMEIAKEQARTHYKHPRFDIGQSSEGDWLLIAY